MQGKARGAGREPTTLSVHLLGAVEVRFGGERLRAFDAPRLQRFLALLILRPELAHRSRLAFELWPDSTESQARTNLRKLLHELRRALPESEMFVEIDTETVRWIPNNAATVDVVEFRSASQAGDLTAAASHYAGDLLPACYDDWILDERAKLRAEAHATFVRLAQQSGLAGDHVSGIEYVQRAINLDPTDESAVRIEMEANLALGYRAAALRSYHRLADVLERELGVAPSDSIAQVYRELRSGTDEVVNEEARAPVLLTESPFVGRDREAALLHDLWADTLQTGPHLVVVTGVPGVGKSRLAEELGRRVRAEGHPVGAARAYEAAGRLPWGPVLDLLRCDALRSRIATLEEIWRVELARLLPELLDTTQTVDPVRSGDLAQRRRLFDAVSRAVVADDRPILLILDDLQWCDAETIELIGFVLRARPSAPLLVVGTLRSEEVPPDHPANRLVEAMEGRQAATTVPLEPLDEAATAMLASELGAIGAADPSFGARLWAETEGNPLFVIEAVRAGVPSEAHGVLTPTMRAVLRARLGQLPKHARELAEVAAVIGRPFSVATLAAATGIGEQALVDRIDELWRRRIIRDQGRAYDFSHDKLRTVALEMVAPARRRRIHREIAEALAGELGRDEKVGAAQLAAHYDQAGMVVPAIDAYRTAGTRAVAMSALEEAVAMFGRALSLLADLPVSGERDSLELDIRLALGSPLVALEGYGSSASHQLYERALSLCRKLGRVVDPPILRGLGLARLQGCRFDDASEMGRALLDNYDADSVSRTEGRYLLGVSAFWRGDLRSAHEHLAGAIVAYDDAHSDDHLAWYAQDPRSVCLVRMGWNHLWVGDPGLADELARSALERAAGLDHLMTRWYVLTYATIMAAESEHLERVAELLQEAEQLQRRLPMPYLMIVGDALRGWLQVSNGSTDGIGEIVNAASRSRTEGENLHLSYTLLLLARAHGLCGNAEEGRAVAQEGLAWTHDCGQRYLEAELLRADGELAAASGQMAEARSSLSSACEVAATQGAGWLELRALVSLARLFPDRPTFERLMARCEATPSGHDLLPFQRATALLKDRAG